MPILLVAFIVVPLVELWAIQQVNEVISLGPTLGLLVLDSLVGAWLVRREGSRAWERFRLALNEGRLPADEIVQGVLVLGGGALLLTPGFVTDGVGLLMVLPPTRALLSRLLRARFVPVPMQVGGSVFQQVRRRRRDDDGPGRGSGDDVVDVEVLSVERDVDEDED